MIASMTLAEIQAKYADVHTPEEVAQFQENMTNSKKWKVAKGEWTWDGLTHVQLRGRALQYHPGLDMVELYKEHPYKTALRLVPKEAAIRKKPLKFNHARQVFTDLGDPYKQHELKIKIGSSFKFECAKDPDVKQAADLLMELSSSASSSSSSPPIWSDEMYSWPQPEVVRLKMQGMPEICVS